MRVNGTEQQQGLIRHLIRRGRKSESTDLSHVDQSVSAVVQLSLRHLYLAQSSTDIATVSQQTVVCKRQITLCNRKIQPLSEGLTNTSLRRKIALI